MAGLVDEGAVWIHHESALKTVLPVKQKVREAPKRRIRTLVDRGVLEDWRRKREKEA